jgi:hypothetical protein
MHSTVRTVSALESIRPFIRIRRSGMLSALAEVPGGAFQWAALYRPSSARFVTSHYLTAARRFLRAYQAATLVQNPLTHSSKQELPNLSLQRTRFARR